MVRSILVNFHDLCGIDDRKIVQNWIYENSTKTLLFRSKFVTLSTLWIFIVNAILTLNHVHFVFPQQSKKKSQHNTWLCSRNQSKTTENERWKKISNSDRSNLFCGTLIVQTVFFRKVKRKYNKINVGKAQYITICCISQFEYQSTGK